MTIEIRIIPGYESWCRVNGKTVPEADGYRMMAEALRAGAKKTIEALPEGESKITITGRG